MRKEIVLAAALALNAGVALADDKPKPQSITIDNCAKVETIVQKVDRPNGTVWLQSVTCTGNAIAPEMRPAMIGYVDGPGNGGAHCNTQKDGGFICW